jgi:predicted RNase H-like HicB family nuclease
MRQYIGLLRQEPDSSYTVAFPDLPGCVAKGLSRDNAFSTAQEAVAAHLEDLRAKGEAIPRPASPYVISNDKANAGAGIITITVPGPPQPEDMISEAIEMIARAYPVAGTALEKSEWMANLQAKFETQTSQAGSHGPFANC